MVVDGLQRGNNIWNRFPLRIGGTQFYFSARFISGTPQRLPNEPLENGMQPCRPCLLDWLSEPVLKMPIPGTKLFKRERLRSNRHDLSLISLKLLTRQSLQVRFALPLVFLPFALILLFGMLLALGHHSFILFSLVRRQN